MSAPTSMLAVPVRPGSRSKALSVSSAVRPARPHRARHRLRDAPSPRNRINVAFGQQLGRAGLPHIATGFLATGDQFGLSGHDVGADARRNNFHMTQGSAFSTNQPIAFTC